MNMNRAAPLNLNLFSSQAFEKTLSESLPSCVRLRLPPLLLLLQILLIFGQNSAQSAANFARLD